MPTPEPKALCARCSAVVAPPAESGAELVCPACGHVAPPAGSMRPSGVPDLQTFRRNIGRAHALDDD